MRNVSKKFAEAFVKRYDRKFSNCHTDGENGFLFGNKISIFTNMQGNVNITLTMAGYGTVTTRDRLNAILTEINSSWRFHQRKHKQYLSGKLDDGREASIEISNLKNGYVFDVKGELVGLTS